MKAMLLLLMLVSGWVQAERPAVLAQVAAQLTSADIVAGEFEQAQQIAVLSRPLVSRGRFVFKRNAGILWEVREPVASSLVLGADGSVAAGIESGASDASEDSAIAGVRALGFVARLLNSVLSGNLAILDDSFHVQGRVEAEGWSLQLTPRSGPLSRLIDRIDIFGAAAVERVVLRDANGDQSTLDFMRVVFPATLPAHASALNEAGGD